MAALTMEAKFIKIKWFFGFGAVTVYPFIFYVNALSADTRRHELIHFEQQSKWVKWYTLYIFGWLAWFFLYLLVLPLGWNYWRFKWEFEAFTKGSGYTESLTKEILRKNYLLFLH